MLYFSKVPPVCVCASVPVFHTQITCNSTGMRRRYAVKTFEGKNVASSEDAFLSAESLLRVVRHVCRSVDVAGNILIVTLHVSLLVTTIEEFV